MPAPKYKQGDLVELKDRQQLPDGAILYHPVLIISCNRAISYQNYYSGIMMSATKHIDNFSMPCDNIMFESPLKEGSHLKIYLILGFNEIEIHKWINRMKPIHFKAVLNQIKDFVFDLEHK